MVPLDHQCQTCNPQFAIESSRPKSTAQTGEKLPNRDGDTLAFVGQPRRVACSATLVTISEQESGEST
jgi:hypothetical protein